MSNREEYEKIEKFLDGHNKIHVRVNDFYNDVVNVDIVIKDALSGYGEDRVVAKIEGLEALFDQDDFEVRLGKDSISKNPEFFFEATEAFLKSEGEEFRDEFDEVSPYAVMSMEKVVDTICEKIDSAVQQDLAERLEHSGGIDKAFDSVKFAVTSTNFDSVEIGDEGKKAYVFTPTVELEGEKHEAWLDIEQAHAGVESRLILDESGDGVGLEQNEAFVKAVENALIDKDVRFRAFDKNDMEIQVQEFIEQKINPKLADALEEASKAYVVESKDEYGLIHKTIDLSRDPQEKIEKNESKKKKRSSSLGFN